MNDIVLTKQVFSNKSYINENYLRDIGDVELTIQRTFDRMILDVRSHVLAHKFGQIIYDFPATVWDHWKQKYLSKFGKIGRWYLKRHPVRKDYKAFSAAAIFPGAKITYPNDLGHVIYKSFPVTNV